MRKTVILIAAIVPLFSSVATAKVTHKSTSVLRRPSDQPVSAPRLSFESKPRLQVECSDGKVSSCNDLGNLLIDNSQFGYRRDAVYYYDTACKGKFAPSCSNLGVEYYSGKNIERDYQSSVEYFEKGCKLKDKYSCKQLVFSEQALQKEEDEIQSRPKIFKPCGNNLDMGLDLSMHRVCQAR